MTANIYQEYFDLTATYQAQYGKDRSLVLMQVGSFYEMYGLRDALPGDVLHNKSNIVQAAAVCLLKIAEKKDKYDGHTVLMAGFGEASLDAKYLPLLVEAGFVCAVYVQEDDMAKRGAKKRVLHGVYSVGTYLPSNDVHGGNNDNHSGSSTGHNHVMVLWLHQYRPLRSLQDRFVCAMATTSCSTGQSFLYEYTTQASILTTTFDEWERAVASFQPSEVILVHPECLQPQDVDAVLQYVGLGGEGRDHRRLVHKVVQQTDVKATHCAKPAYIDALLTAQFGPDCLHQTQEFATYEYATQAYCYLLDFLQQHSPDLVRRLQLPSFSNSSQRLLLGNHTLRQLNVLGGSGKRGSVAAFLNEAVTPMGRRLMHQHIVEPVFDVAWLQREYDAVHKYMQDSQGVWVRKELQGVRDVDRILRDMVRVCVSPASLWHLTHVVEVWSKMVDTDDTIADTIADTIVDTDANKKNQASVFLHDVQHRLDGAVAQEATSHHNLPCRIVKPGMDERLDQLLEECDQVRRSLETFRERINEAVGGDHVKWHDTVKSGASFLITTARGQALKQWMAKMPADAALMEGVLYKDIGVTPNTGSKEATVSCGATQSWFRRLAALEERCQQTLQRVYEGIVKNLTERWLTWLQEVSADLARIDVWQSKAYVATVYGYCRPEMDPTRDDGPSFVDARGLRHPLIEHLQTRELYVANDVTLHDDDTPYRGMLLYGTNAVGKTSLIKALGLAVLMAQAGMYVPCTSFRYRPYRAVYSRILGNDDLFRGLSTFVVEMSELRTILREAGPHTLVLGDEVCSGTETESALSIFTAALLHLHDTGASFVFATHFHEVAHYQEVAVDMADAVVLKHMAVTYDAAQDTLVYDRKLRDGPGPAIYGLEVAKSLHMPVAFLETAFRLRSTYFPHRQTLLSAKTSAYNAAFVVSPVCQVCRRACGEEVHHKKPQRLADPMTGLIAPDVPGAAPFHKNHPANLMTVCAACHDAFHTTQR